MNISPDGVSIRFKTEPKELFEAEKSGAKPNTVQIVDQDEYIRLVKANPEKIIIQYKQEIFLRTITHIHVTEGVFGKVIVVISWTNEKHHHVPTVGPHSVPVEPGPHNISPDYVPEMPNMPSICKCANCIKGNEIEDDFHVHTIGLDEVEGADHRPRVSQIPIAKTMRCPDCDGDLLKSRAGEFGKCTICQALFYLDRGMESPAEEPPLCVQAINISLPLREKLDALRGSETYDELISGLITPELPTKLDKLVPILLPLTLIHDLGRHRRGRSHADFIQELLLAHLNKLVGREGADA